MDDPESPVRTVDLTGHRFRRAVYEATCFRISSVRRDDLQARRLWWMFAATRSWLGSNWDTLSVFWASELTGHGSPMPEIPSSSIIAAHARLVNSFVAMVHVASWQDCSDGYGSGLRSVASMARSGSLCARAFRAPFGCVMASSARAAQHDRAGGIEVIDLYGAPPDRRLQGG